MSLEHPTLTFKQEKRRSGLVAMILLAVVGCTNVAQVTTLDDPSCKSTVRDQLNSVLIEEGEKSEIAERLAVNTTTVLATGVLGPRPFGVSSPSGVDYSFFIQRKDSECFLQLYGRQKGFTRYTNNLTYIATRSLNGCMCTE
jgi:RNA polymerase subunit RPABC4/transcription elongation factor Spt4